MSQPQEGQKDKIVNAKTGTVLDVSGVDNQTISGYTDHGGDNQKFRLEKNDEGRWLFRVSHTDHYVGVNGFTGDGTPLVAVEEPFGWDMYPDDEDGSVYRIYVPGAPAPLNWDLSDHGSATPGTIVTLWGKWEGRHQCWRFVEA
ncbi:hypothetical protein K435DRAFT_778372 [Dendrothele bispora CBS 962.96]|uniref:Ricin B lectin domain-containing protein n=1 Tax=Dendrothele bispora (strain CBS 962.96) TaxID=1314807 RepID=A0A4V4HFY9_DENBC|nr:hypothetical protein K435DRAFT_778372 [Dendrothele bispora CBS 962.96]